MPLVKQELLTLSQDLMSSQF